MPRYLCDLFFNRADGNGWSETYPLVASDPSVAVSALGLLRVARLATLVSDCWLAGARVSDTDIKGDSYPTGFTFPTPGNFATVPADHTYTPRKVVLRVLFYADDFTRRSNRWVRSIPASAFDATGKYTAPSPYTGPLGAWLSEIQSNCSIATKIKGAVSPPFYTFRPIASGSYTPVQDERNIGRPFGLPVGRRLIA